MIYPLVRLNKKSALLKPTHSSYSDEYASRMCDLYLSDEIHKDENGKMHKYFRLHARQPHSIEDALVYDIKCPECNRHNNLKMVGRILNYNDLGLYICPQCDNE